MDLSSLIGICVAYFAIIVGIALTGVGFGPFIDLPSIFVVVVGSAGAMFFCAPMFRVTGIGKLFGIVFNGGSAGYGKIMQQLISFSEKARREGLLALEDSLEEIEVAFMKNGLQLVVDGSDPEVIKSVLNNDTDQMSARHEANIGFFETWSSLAPAYGMIGTLMGLIAMLTNLQDTAGLASGMSVALITTMYGSIMSNTLFTPVAKKLGEKHADEMLVRVIITEGILSIQSGDNPKVLEQKLLGFVPPSERETATSE